MEAPETPIRAAAAETGAYTPRNRRRASDATIEGAGTLVVASCAYWLMGLDIVQHLVFVFPETLLIALAFMLLFGRYTGYRLSEIKRFKAIRNLRR